MAYYNQYVPFLKLAYPSYLSWEIKNSENKIYLTFDDGPVPDVTEYVLEVLRKFNIKATFFCVGDNVVKHPAILLQILQDRHSVGNHTHHHIKGWDVSEQTYMQNIKLCDEALLSYDVLPRLFRPPYGKATKAQLKQAHKTHQIVMWNVLTGDFDQQQSEEACLQEAIIRTKSGSIILFHDSYKAERNMRYALPRFIESCLSKGFQFEKL